MPVATPSIEVVEVGSGADVVRRRGRSADFSTGLEIQEQEAMKHKQPRRGNPAANHAWRNSFEVPSGETPMSDRQKRNITFVRPVGKQKKS